MQRVGHCVATKAHRELVFPQMKIGGTERRICPHQRDESAHKQQQTSGGLVRDKVVEWPQEAVDFFKAHVIHHYHSHTGEGTERRRTVHTVSLTLPVQKSMPHPLTIVQLCCMIHDAYAGYRL